jgi:hypothetical protein
MVDVGPSLVLLSTIIVWRPDDEVGIAVAVDVPRRAYGATKVVLRLVALGGPVCVCA